MRIAEIDKHAFRVSLRQDEKPILARCQNDIDECAKALRDAGETLRAAQEARQQGFARLADLNCDFANVSTALRNSKTLVLRSDQNHLWIEVRKNRERRAQLGDLIAWQALVLQENELAVQMAEVGVESAKADYLEAGACLDRVKIMIVADQARDVDAGAVVNLDDSASAKILARVKRTRETDIPAAEERARELQNKLMLAKEQATSTLFG